ncbi:class I SAM-dependent methyltransferase [Algoriphagus marinus]|uniref:class I SAM-dependent methyltransferase n=1 Tax=Algoriphagus marinus TaxID=1925762 RepID=UPI0009F93838|nr:class I SAM-dependent methyltransferase [Algoriphagus marinus]
MNPIKKIVGRIYKNLYKNYFLFKDSNSYWNARYKSGRNSGDGSYGRLAEFKAAFLNDFVDKENINSIIEFGCGDGNQLSLMNYKNYLGLDISEFILNKCRKKFNLDKSKRFELTSNYAGEKADLSISLDVIFHLVEDSVFDLYMKNLFTAANKFVIIYSSNEEISQSEDSLHVRHRKFTDWVDSNIIEFGLIETKKNEFDFTGEKGTSKSDFFIYKKL